MRRSSPKNSLSKQDPDLSMDELERQLELAARVESALAKVAPVKREPATFNISLEEGQAVTACTKGEGRSMLQWLFSSLHGVIATHTKDRSPLLSLEAALSAMLSSRPQTPAESLLLAQLFASHSMAMEFGSRAVNASDASVATRLAERSKSFMEVSVRQMETLMKLRGEAVSQKVVVEHVHMSDGAQAIIGNAQSVVEQVGVGDRNEGTN